MNVKIGRAVLTGVVAMTGAVLALAAPAQAASTAATIAPLALNPVNCSDAGAIHVNVPYYPYTYCYSGLGNRHVQLTQVTSVETRNWTTTLLFRNTAGGVGQVGLVPHETYYLFGGYLDTISVP